MEEKILQAILLSRKNYIDFQKFSIWANLSDQGQIIYNFVSEYYHSDIDAESVDKDILCTRITRQYPKQGEIYESIINKLYEDPQGNLSVPNLIKEITTVKKDSLGRELSLRLLQSNHTQVGELMEEYLLIEESIQELFDDEDALIDFPIKDLAMELSSSQKIKLFPKRLQELTGGALGGNNILIFGRPEVGKSLFAINMLGGFLHSGYKVLFIENEEPAKATLSRIVSRITQKNIFEILENPEKIQEELNNTNYKNLILKSLSPGTFNEINSLIERFEPDIVIINQVHNINVGKSETVIQRERVAKQSRNTAKKYDIVMINVCQAGESASNKLVLDMEDIDFSNTGMPAQYDLIIGVGCNDEFETRGRRMISLCKNKLSGTHDYFPVGIDKKISRIIPL